MTKRPHRALRLLLHAADLARRDAARALPAATATPPPAVADGVIVVACLAQTVLACAATARVGSAAAVRPATEAVGVRVRKRRLEARTASEEALLVAVGIAPSARCTAAATARSGPARG